MFVLDTNVLVYAADRDSPHFPIVRARIEALRRQPAPVFLTWSICYEFLRVVTHARVLRQPWPAVQAWRFLDALLVSPGFSVLEPTGRHAAVLAQTMEQLPELAGNQMHDLHIAVLMREHGISSIYTRDADFHRFPFLKVLDPVHGD